jgi:hypothetical protein
MGRSINSYRTLAIALLATTVVVGLTAGAILAQSNPPGPGASTQHEPIKRTVLFRGDLEGAPGNRRRLGTRSGGREALSSRTGVFLRAGRYVGS